MRVEKSRNHLRNLILAKHISIDALDKFHSNAIIQKIVFCRCEKWFNWCSPVEECQISFEGSHSCLKSCESISDCNFAQECVLGE